MCAFEGICGGMSVCLSVDVPFCLTLCGCVSLSVCLSVCLSLSECFCSCLIFCSYSCVSVCEFGSSPWCSPGCYEKAHVWERVRMLPLSLTLITLYYVYVSMD